MTTRATIEPAQLRAGMTWEWARTFGDYPASAWALAYWFKQLSAGGAHFKIDAVADGDTFVVTKPASETASLTADEYSWVAVVTAGGESHEVGRGTLRLLPRYDSAAALDDRSHARKVLEAIEAVIEGRASKDQEEYTIGSRSLKRTPIAELLELRKQYRRELADELAAEQGVPAGPLGRVRYGVPQ